LDWVNTARSDPVNKSGWESTSCFSRLFFVFIHSDIAHKIAHFDVGAVGELVVTEHIGVLTTVMLTNDNVFSEEAVHSHVVLLK